jgi:hypothetical protein
MQCDVGGQLHAVLLVAMLLAPNEPTYAAGCPRIAGEQCS